MELVGEREPCSAGAGAELDDTEQRPTRGGRTREEVREGREESEECGCCGGPELDPAATRSGRGSGSPDPAAQSATRGDGTWRGGRICDGLSGFLLFFI